MNRITNVENMMSSHTIGNTMLAAALSDNSRDLKTMTHDEANELWLYLGLNPEYENLWQHDGFPENTTLKYLQEYFFREPKFGGHSERFDFKKSVKLIYWLCQKVLI